MEEVKKEIYKSSSKRIAVNTMMLYTRHILIILVSLYTSRVVLQVLGAEDYGIYNVVGGFVTMFNIISGAFSVAIARFMAYTLESGNKKELQKLFSTAIITQIFMGILIFILIATFGVWYVRHKMVLPDTRVNAALAVLLFSAVSFFISLLSVPYNAVLIAYEKMKAFAYISILEVVLKLMVVFFVALIPWDKLVVYSMMMVASAMVIRFIYIYYCKKHFSECEVVWELDKNIFLKMLSFTGWAFLGNGAVIIKDQGINMILNLFGGPIVNAARAIAVNVNSAIGGFVENFTKATQPQITRLCSSKQYDEMHRLVLQSCKISFFLSLAMCLPLIENMEYILFIWLGEVPTYTSFFVIFTLIDLLIVSLNKPLLYGVLADGRIKIYEILLALTYILGTVFVYFWLKGNGSIEFVYVITVFLRVLVLIYLVWQSKETYCLSVRDFLKNVFFPVVLVAFGAALLTNKIDVNIAPAFLDFIIECILSVVGTLVLVVIIGITSAERNSVKNAIKKKLKLIQRGR